MLNALSPRAASCFISSKSVSNSTCVRAVVNTPKYLLSSPDTHPTSRDKVHKRGSSALARSERPDLEVILHDESVLAGVFAELLGLDKKRARNWALAALSIAGGKKEQGESAISDGTIETDSLVGEDISTLVAVLDALLVLTEDAVGDESRVNRWESRGHREDCVGKLGIEDGVERAGDHLERKRASALHQNKSLKSHTLMAALTRPTSFLTVSAPSLGMGAAVRG